MKENIKQMLKINTRIKKIWLIWFLSYLAVISLLLLILSFLIDKDIISNIFSGFSVLALIILTFSYFSSKQNTHNERKNKEKKIETSVLHDYFQEDETLPKNAISIVSKKRILYQTTFALSCFLISVIPALIYGLAL